MKLFDDIEDIRKTLDCDNLIDSFEKRWSEWDINDTIEWFKFVLNQTKVDDSGDDNINIELQDDDDEKKQLEMTVTETIEIDFEDIKSNLLQMKFNCKKYFPILLKLSQFETFGFKNMKDQEYLCKKVKQLMKKYPDQTIEDTN